MGWREATLAVLGAGLGLWLAELGSGLLLQGVPLVFLASMGASAVLLFAVPTSPLAQPWPMLGGNVVSALVGVACQHALGSGGGAAALASAAAIALMIVLRCLHPPGGAVALTAVLGGPTVLQMGWGFAFWPVGLNACLMLGLAWLFHRISGRRYPHHGAPQPHRTQDPPPSHRGGIERGDLDAALASFGEWLDVDRDDLEEVMARAQLHALHRHWGGLNCGDIMSRDVVSVGPDDAVDEAWSRLARHQVKSLPVVDGQGRLVGIVSMHDFFLGQTSPDPRQPPRLLHARRVHELMTREVVRARPEQPIAELVPAFSDQGLHHLPVVDAQDRVVGMVTQSDLVMALFRAGVQRPYQ
jgi:CBS domain-containing membrane protein